jgi:hypothetical protein
MYKNGQQNMQMGINYMNMPSDRNRSTGPAKIVGMGNNANYYNQEIANNDMGINYNNINNMNRYNDKNMNMNMGIPNQLNNQYNNQYNNYNHPNINNNFNNMSNNFNNNNLNNNIMSNPYVNYENVFHND